MTYKDKNKRTEYSKEYYQRNKKQLKQKAREYRQKHRIERNESSLRYYYKHRKKEKVRAKRYYQRNKNKIKDKNKRYSLTSHSKFLHYKAGAKSRNRPFELSEEQFMTFWQKPCYYCGSSISTIGLDRIDGIRGYTIDNIVSCCSVCNFMKHTLSIGEFLEYCRKISKKHNL